MNDAGLVRGKRDEESRRSAVRDMRTRGIGKAKSVAPIRNARVSIKSPHQGREATGAVKANEALQFFF